MSLNTFFNEIHCINLKYSHNRWIECKEEFAKQRIRNVTRFEAIHGIPEGFTSFGDMGVNATSRNFQQKIAARVGCLLSHLTLIKTARQFKLKNILILEDDVQFAKDANKIFSEIESQIPDDWGLLYLGGNEKDQLKKVNSNIYSTSNMLMAHAVGINENIYDDLIRKISECKIPVDVYYAQAQKEFPSYTIYPYMAWQRAGWSEIEQRFRIFDFEHTSPSLEKILKCKRID